MLGGILGAAALAAVPAYGLNEAPSGCRLPGYAASVLPLASALLVALVVLVWQIFRTSTMCWAG
ncbi:MAG: hypothetical protein ABSF62_19465 [Bryobacteraceae bacterium]